MEVEGKQNATASLQALEKLYLMSKNFANTQYNSELKDKIRTTLDQLREIKSMVERSHDDFVPLSINKEPLMELKQLLLMHVPSSIGADKSRFSQLIDQSLKDHCQKILAGVVLTCPWYAATQKERGEQAKHNILLVIVMNQDRQFFSPASPQTKEAGGVVDLGWLSVIELFHFGRFLVKGRTRYVEAAFCDQNALVYSSEEWLRLREELSISSVTGLRPFLEACCGQAMGSVAKKRKNGGMKLRDNVTIAEICEAFRLLHHAHNHFQNEAPVTDGLIPPSRLPDLAAQALDKLKALYKEPDVSKQDIFLLLAAWHDELRERMKKCGFSNQKDVISVVGSWMMGARLQGRTLTPATGPGDAHSHLLELMQEIGGPLTKLKPEQIVLVARAGSYMYGLSTASSDVDYVVVYNDTTESVLSACSKPAECFENRGPSKAVEYGAYEVRLLCEMLLKSSVVILELVYIGDHDYVSPHWQRLHDNKEKFVTELGIQQYLGLIKNNFAMIHSHKHKDTGRERKLFYQIFHKMDSVRHMMTGVAPPVRVTGPVRDFIMDIRTKDLEGNLSREAILDRATSEYDDLLLQLASRKDRLPENPDYSFLTDWLLFVRGDIFI